MIEPDRIGPDLIRAMEIARPGPGQVWLWPLGQAGWAIRFHEATAYIDLYLSNNAEAALARPFDHRRLTRAPLDPAEINDADIVICTHDHLDHLDVPTIRSLADASPAAVIVAPACARAKVESLGWHGARAYTTSAGDDLTVKGLSLKAFAVAHDDYDEGEQGHSYQGFVLSDGIVTVCHVGDARYDESLVRIVRSASPDVLLLPINGRSPERRSMGYAGNMTAEEAAQLATEGSVPLVAPMHYDMFAQNTDRDALARFQQALGRATTTRSCLTRVGSGFLVDPSSPVEAITLGSDGIAGEDTDRLVAPACIPRDQGSSADEPA